MKRGRVLFILLGTCLFWLSCGTTKEFNPGPVHDLNQTFDDLNLSSKLHTGLSIYDLQKGKSIFNYRDDNFFTSASCTKLLTLYTVLRYMDDSVPAAFYRIKGDTITVWGAGDPGTLYPDIHGKARIVDFLKSVDKTIIFSDDQFTTTRYGTGWAWDDYPYNFQTERTAFPIYGNRLWIDRIGDSISITPRYFKEILTIKKDTAEITGRDEWGDSYYYHYDTRQKEAHVSIPVSFFEHDVRLMWSNVIGKNIDVKDIPVSGNVSVIEGTPRDTLLKTMMQESDNFIAEQLLLACSMKQAVEMNEEAIIDKVLTGPLVDLSSEIVWWDGSGLSRYNMMTPHALVTILTKVINQNGLDYIKSILPAGGVSGTIEDDFKGIDGKPYIYAKSGSMHGVYNLTGILITNSGKVLLFSWMNNEFAGDAEPLKLSMQYLFTYLRDNY